MATKRRILIDALDAWRAEGMLDESAHRFLRSRYENAPPSPDLDGVPIGVSGVASGVGGGEGAAAVATRERPSFAADAMQFVGGLLLGAAAIALVVFLELEGGPAAWILSLVGAALVAGGLFAGHRGLRRPLVDAALAAGLVPLTVGAFMGMIEGLDALPIAAAIVSGAIVPLRRGEGPSALLGVIAFSLTSWGAVFADDRSFFDEPDALLRALWMMVLIGYGAVLLRWRDRVWVGASLALYVGALTLSFASIADLWRPESVAMELAIGAFLGALLAVGIFVGSRGLVAGAAAGLTIDAVVFAFDVGGPGTAVVVLLALGGLLVWQAEVVRRYFRRSDR